MFDPTLRCLHSLAKYLLFSLHVSVVAPPVCEALLHHVLDVNIHLFASVTSDLIVISYVILAYAVLTVLTVLTQC